MADRAVDPPARSFAAVEAHSAIPIPSLITRALITFAAYGLTATLGLNWALASGAASPVWPAAGVAVAAVFLWGRLMAVPIVIGFVAASVVTGGDQPFWSQLLIGFGNALAALIGAWLLRRVGPPDVMRFAALRSVLALLAAAIAAPLVSALIGVSALSAAEALPAELTELAIRGWLFGDSVGILIITALLLSWSREAGGAARRLQESPWLLAIGASVVLLSYFVFFGESVARAWAIYPGLVWAALAYRARGASAALTLSAIVAVLGTEIGLGPFARTGNGGPDLLLLQQFLAVSSATVLLLAAAIDERDSQAELRASRESELAARDELARVEAILSLVTESAPIAIFAKDLEGRYIYANSPVIEATRMTRDELIGETDTRWAPPELVAELRANDHLAMTAEAPLDIEEVLTKEDGAAQVWRGLKAPLRDADGAIIGVVGVSLDITERKASEDQLARLAERAELAQRAARSSLYDHDPATGYSERDPLILELAGYRPDAIPPTREGWETLIDPEDRRAFRSTISKALARAERFALEYRVRTASGSIMWVSDVGRIIRDGGGELVRIVGLITDITERREGEEKLRLRTAELESLLGSAPIGLAFFDRDYRYLRINKELADINGIPAEEHIGRSIRELLPANAAAMEPTIDRVFETGKSVGNLEIAGETPLYPGLLRHWIAGFFPVAGASGSVEAVGSWVIEITDRKLSEERERLLAREVDHRAKNLLAVVQSVVQLSRADDPAAFRDSVVGRIQSLGRAHSLLAASRWEGVSLTDLAVEELAPYAIDGEERVTIEGPRLQLRPAAAQSLALALHELATNAVKYGALRTADGKLDLRWRRQNDGSLRLQWKEVGAGEQQSPARSGFGARVISASIERQLGGIVERDWGPDGLQVTITLPAGQIADMRTEAPLPLAELDPLGPEEQPHTSTRRLLIVEDEALIGLEVEQAMVERGFNVVGIAPNVGEALRLVESVKPEVALLDVNLHGELSFPVAEALLKTGAKVVFCTGYDNGGLVPPQLSHLTVLRKPFRADEVAAALN